jgi:hypothetical protein
LFDIMMLRAFGHKCDVVDNSPQLTSVVTKTHVMFCDVENLFFIDPGSLVSYIRSLNTWIAGGAPTLPVS